MPPPLALLLCTGFVVYLLRLERKQAPDVSRTVWIPTVWAMASAVKPLASWFGTQGYGDVQAGSPLDRAFVTGLILAGILILAGRKSDWQSFKRQ